MHALTGCAALPAGAVVLEGPPIQTAVKGRGAQQLGRGIWALGRARRQVKRDACMAWGRQTVGTWCMGGGCMGSVARMESQGTYMELHGAHEAAQFHARHGSGP